MVIIYLYDYIGFSVFFMRENNCGMFIYAQ